MKSMLITSHFHFGMGSSCSNPAGCWCFSFTCLHSMPRAKYYATSFFTLGQKKSFLIIVVIFLYPRCPEYRHLCNSSIKSNVIPTKFGMYNMFLCSSNPLPFILKSVFIWFLSFYVVFSFRF